MLEFIENNISYYSLCAFAGLLVTLLVYFILGRKRKVPGWQLFSMFLFAGAGLLIGAHLLFFIVGLPDWIAKYSGAIHSFQDFLIAFGYGASGLVFYGGLLGAYAGILIFCKMYKFYTPSELNNATVVFPLFHCFGRIGCALNGCCYGIEYHGFLEMHYDESHIVQGINDDIVNFPRFPIQYLEAFLELLIFVFLLILYIKTRDRYSLTSIYLLIYSVIRFFDEFLRGDAARKIWGPFSTSQWISLIIFVSVMIYLTVKRLRFKRGPRSFFSA